MQNTFTRKLSPSDLSALEANLDASSMTKQEDSNQYVAFRYKADGKSIVAYTSGKVVLQGRGVDEAWVAEICTPPPPRDADASRGGSGTGSDHRIRGDSTHNAHRSSSNSDNSKDDRNDEQKTFFIGGDESGKGDFFGPLVVAMVGGDGDDIAWLEDLGVADSKKLKDKNILPLADKIMQRLVFVVNILVPAVYNDSYASVTNIALLLADTYGRLADLVLASGDEQTVGSNSIADYEPDNVVITIDQFSKNSHRLSDAFAPLLLDKSITLEQYHRAERNPIVAAASIVARAEFVRAMEQMAKEWDMEFPKGATNVIPAGKEFVAKHGADNLHKVAKMHFKTAGQVLDTAS